MDSTVTNGVYASTNYPTTLKDQIAPRVSLYSRLGWCLIICSAFLIFPLGYVYAQSDLPSCATWGNTKTQLLRLEIGETKVFQLPEAFLPTTKPACVATANDLQYTVESSSTPTLPTGFTFDANVRTIRGCSNSEISRHTFNVVASGPASCSCQPAELEALLRVRGTSDQSSCSTTQNPDPVDSENLDTSTPANPWPGHKILVPGSTWTHAVGLNESNQGARITYSAVCLGEYSLEDNYLGFCPDWLRSIQQDAYTSGVVYLSKSIPSRFNTIGIYHVRVIASKEESPVQSSTIISLEVVDPKQTIAAPTLEANEPNQLKIILQVSDENLDYITGFDLEIENTEATGDKQVHKLGKSIRSLTIASLKTDTLYRVRVRTRGGAWSSWVSQYTLGNEGPLFDNTRYTFHMRENLSGADEAIELGTVTARDPNNRDTVTYYIEDDSQDAYRINTNTGVLSYVGTGEDHESTPTREITVRAQGGTGARAISTRTIVRIVISNVEEPLMFASDARIDILNDLDVGVEYDFQLPLAEGGDGQVVYSVHPNLPRGLSIGPTTGRLYGTPSESTSRTSYEYRATDAEGDSISLSFSFRVFGRAPKRPTSLVVAERTSFSLTIEWTNPADPHVQIQSHDIEYRKQGTRRLTTLNIPGPATQHTITDLERNTSYEVRVKNIATDGYVSFSDFIESATSPYAHPGIPRSLNVVSVAFDMLGLEWSSPDDDGGRSVSGYEVRFREEGTRVWLVRKSQSEELNLRRLEQGVTYEMQVRAINSIGSGNWSESVFATTRVNSRPHFAAGYSVPHQTYSVGENIATLQLPSASEGDGALQYDLSPTLPQGLTYDTDRRDISGTPTETSERLSYTYAVTDSDNYEVDDSDSLTFTISVYANTPLTTTIAVGEILYDRVSLSWNAPDGRGAEVSQYNIELRHPQGEALLQTLTIDSGTSVTVMELAAETTYEVRIRSTNSVGISEWSDWVSFTTAQIPVSIRVKPLEHALQAVSSLEGSSTVDVIGDRASPNSKERENSSRLYATSSASSRMAADLIERQNALTSCWTQSHSDCNADRAATPQTRNSFANSLNNINFEYRSNPDGDESGINWSIWGRGQFTSFDGRITRTTSGAEPQDLKVDGDGSVVFGWVGIEVSPFENARFGVAVSRSNSTTEFDRVNQAATATETTVDEIEISLTSVNPYVTAALSEDLVIWGTVGRGSGEAKLTDRYGELADINLTKQLFAVGLRFDLADPSETGFALKSDYFDSEVSTDAEQLIPDELSGASSRFRIGVEGRTYFTSQNLRYVPTFEVMGRFDDGGIADGTNLSAAMGLDVLMDGGWALGFKGGLVRGTGNSEYSEFSASAYIRRESNPDGTGASFNLVPVWGAMNDPFALDSPQESHFASSYSQMSRHNMQIEYAYGFRAFRDRSILRPYTHVILSDLSEQLRLGLQFKATSNTVTMFNMDVSTSLRSRSASNDLVDIVLRGSLTY